MFANDAATFSRRRAHRSRRAVSAVDPRLIAIELGLSLRLRVDRPLAPLRGEPRYVALIEKPGFPK